MKKKSKLTKLVKTTHQRNAKENIKVKKSTKLWIICNILTPSKFTYKNVSKQQIATNILNMSSLVSNPNLICDKNS